MQHLGHIAGLSLLLLGTAMSAWSGVAQDAPLKGVVWQMPANRLQAENDLLLMQRRGIEAVRTGIVRDTIVLAMADTLGLQLFQELPVTGLAASQLLDTLASVRRELEEALARAPHFSSTRHFGIARRSDTSAQRACDYVEELAGRVRAVRNARVYYTSVFVESDRCAAAVDFVLLETRDANDPKTALQEWMLHHPDTPAGIGALGTWVDNRQEGLLQPHSVESQARYLETHLPALLDQSSSAKAVFVHRWRDGEELTIRGELPQPGVQHYGLFAANGLPRPASAVLEGIYNDTQHIFAFKTGTATPQPFPWHFLIGWLPLFLVGIWYASMRQFRGVTLRYFVAHNYYQEAVRIGREINASSGVLLLIVLAISAGVTGSLFLQTMQQTTALHHLVDSLPVTEQRMVQMLLARPLGLIFALASIYALGISLWGAFLSEAIRRRHPLEAAQVLILVLMTHWPCLLLLLASLTVSSLFFAYAAPMLIAVAGLWILMDLWAAIRTLRDCVTIGFVQTPMVFLFVFARPLPLLFIAGLVLYALSDEAANAIDFAWRLAIHT